MIEGAYRFPRQDTVIYGRPAHEAVVELAKRYNASRLFLLTTRSLGGSSGSAAKFAAALGPLCIGTFDAISSHSPRSDVIAGAAAQDGGAQHQGRFPVQGHAPAAVPAANRRTV